MDFGKYFFKGNLEEGEKILYIAHRHVLVLKLSSAKTSFFGIAMPIFLYILFPQLLIFVIPWLLCGFAGLAFQIFDWYCDVWILTNVGVIDIHRNGLFDITSTRIDYHMIEGISYRVNGVLQTIFNYGDITVDKLGSKTSVVLNDAANPKNLERIVMKYQEKYVADKSVRDHHALKGMLAEMISYHVQNQMIDNDKK